MKKTLFFILAGIITLPLTLRSQSNLPVFAGNVKSVTSNERSVKVITDNAVAEIFAYSPTVIRIRVAKQEPGAGFSYAVIQSPGAGFNCARA